MCLRNSSARENRSASEAHGLLTIVVDCLSNASTSSFLFTEGVFNIKRVLYPLVTIEQVPIIPVVALVYGKDGG